MYSIPQSNTLYVLQEIIRVKHTYDRNLHVMQQTVVSGGVQWKYETCYLNDAYATTNIKHVYRRRN